MRFVVLIIKPRIMCSKSEKGVISSYAREAIPAMVYSRGGFPMTSLKNWLKFAIACLYFLAIILFSSFIEVNFLDFSFGKASAVVLSGIRKTLRFEEIVNLGS